MITKIDDIFSISIDEDNIEYDRILVIYTLYIC